MNNLKIKTNPSNERIASVILNDEEISYKISGLTLKMGGGKIPKAIIEVPLSEIEVEGEFDVLKKIPKEEKTYNFEVEEITEEFIKEIGAHLEKALRETNKS